MIYNSEQGDSGAYKNSYGAESSQATSGDPQTPNPPYQVPVSATVQASAPRKSRAWIVALAAVIMLCFVLVVSLFSCVSALDEMGNMLGGGSSVNPTSPSIGVIELDSEIAYDGSVCSPEGLKAQLDYAASNPNIKAVVLHVNSGGGAATAGEEMSIYVRDFSKPIVVSSASMNASAAYEISSQADYIFTAKTTAIGSIGTVMQTTDISGLLGKLGITIDNITSSDSKDSSYGTRPLSESERAYYQAMVNQINDTFIQAVAEGRNMSVDEVKKLATGLPFTGIMAVENGLADSLGTLEDAIKKAEELASVTNCEVVYLEPAMPSVIMQLLGAMGEYVGTTNELLTYFKEQSYVGRIQ